VTKPTNPEPTSRARRGAAIEATVPDGFQNPGQAGQEIPGSSTPLAPRIENDPPGVRDRVPPLFGQLEKDVVKTQHSETGVESQHTSKTVAQLQQRLEKLIEILTEHQAQPGEAILPPHVAARLNG